MDKERVKKLVRELIIEIGEDPTREGLKDTPRRIADAYTEIFSGYDSDSELSVQFSEDSEMVVAKNIQFYSMCEHHMLPFYGTIQIAYIPNDVGVIAVMSGNVTTENNGGFIQIRRKSLQVRKEVNFVILLLS